MDTEIQLFESTDTKALSLVTEKDKLFTVNFTSILLLCENDKFVHVHNKCSKIPPSTSMYFATHG